MLNFYSKIDPTAITNASTLDAFLLGDGTFQKLFDQVSISDANYNASNDANTLKNRYLKYTSITAARSVTLPLASSSPGQLIIIADSSGSCSATNTITIQCSGSDVIHTVTSTALNSAYAYIILISNGTALWKVLARNSYYPTITNLTTLNHNPASHYNCGGGCSWTCVSGCTTSCVSCTASCANQCVTCTSCTGGCSAGCSTCSGTCSSCTGCTGGCSGNCTVACSGTCSGCTGCSSGCSGSCNTGCTGSCTGGCTGCGTCSSGR